MIFLVLCVVLGATFSSINCSPESRIINGHTARPGEAPFIVSIQNDRVGHFCGGSIIHPNWVLTAAHCLNQPSIKLVAGLHKRLDKSNAQIRKAKSKQFWVTHEKYNFIYYDIALVFISVPFDLEALLPAAVSTISLPTGRYELTGKGKLFGWGLVNSGERAEVLQALDVDIIGGKECNVDDISICSYTPGTSDGPCSSDSGGPLVRYTPEGPELVGIVSYGVVPCNNRDSPSVYVNVNAYKNWINNTISNFSVPNFL